ncbi:uncharacterized protein LOC134527687 [Bacillus rossius redtenbacheri]|uniref:uncharacterized protein LOC134527687 n=1 Tax=Bacillus rossius redtenbacheri TaxID=93214 RepID=UPI002FDD5891
MALAKIFSSVAAAGSVIVSGMIALDNQVAEIERISSSSSCRFKVQYIDNEYDVHERDAVVYLCTSATAALPDAECIELHHWTILVYFEDGAFRTLDGDCEDDDEGRIYGHYSKERRPEYHHMIELGSVMTSPYKLWKCVRDCALNGTPYNATVNNCQDWVLAVAKKLGNHIYKKLQEQPRLSPIAKGSIGMFHALRNSALHSSS